MNLLNSIIKDKPEIDCAEIHSLLKNELESLDKNNSLITDELILLMKICSLGMDKKKEDNPYGPFLVLDGKRTFDIIDLTKDEKNVLKDLQPKITHPSLAARLNDILWILFRSEKYLKNAVSYYKEYLKIIKDLDNWTLMEIYLTRAFFLSWLIRKKNNRLFIEITNYIEDLICEAITKTISFFPISFAELLLKYRLESKTFSLFKDYAEKSAKKKKWLIAEKAWELFISIEFKRKSKNIEYGYKKLAEIFIKQANAEKIRKNPNYHIITHHYIRAIEVLRKIKNTKKERNALYTKLRLAQKKSIYQLAPITHKIDISDSVEYTIKKIKKKKFINAIFIFAFELFWETDYNKIKKQIKNRKNTLLQNLFHSTYLDKEGKIISKRKPIIDTKKELENEFFQTQIFQSSRLYHQVVVNAVIYPFINEIKRYNHISENTIMQFCRYNPYIPDGQEYLFAMGFNAGFNYDFITAMSVLIPIFENQLRLILKINGIHPTSLNPYGIQEAKRMNSILNEAKLSKILGKNIIMDLKGLLIDTTYGNLRNKVAHGLLNYDEFFSISMIYLWALILKITLLPFHGNYFKTKK